MRYSLVLALATGCSMNVGAGSIEPVEVDEPIDPTLASPPVSLEVEGEFLSESESNSFADQLGGRFGAVQSIDVEVQELGIVDLDGTTVPGSAFVLEFEGVTIDHVGQRVRLPITTKQMVLGAVAKRASLTLPMQVMINWPTPSPPAMGAHALLQPIVVINLFDAL
jgi:hypothetical protein